MSEVPSPQSPGGSGAAAAAVVPRKQPRTVSPWSLLLGGAVLAAIVLGQWTWLVPILGLALLITVHEFGHFIAAKSFGMRVEKFYVGFPPAALRRTWLPFAAVAAMFVAAGVVFHKVAPEAASIGGVIRHVLR